MTLQEFWDRLSHHDWFYQMSDDHSVWSKGVAASNALRAISDTSEAHRALYDGWARHMFTGDPWGTENAPKPERPEDA